MKTSLISILAICFGVCVPAAAWAADDHNDQNKGGERGAQSVQQSAPQHSAPAAGSAHGSQGSGRNANSAQQRTPVSSMNTTQSRTHQHQVTQTQGGGTFGTTSGPSTGAMRTRHSTTGMALGAATTNNTRVTTRTHPNINVASYNRNITAQHRYRSGNYSGPQGYSYHRYGYGDQLPREYYANNFWIVDFSAFGLLSPPYGYAWVRYGPDAILIDENTGEIVQVVYNQFYS